MLKAGEKLGDGQSNPLMVRHWRASRRCVHHIRMRCVQIHPRERMFVERTAGRGVCRGLRRHRKRR